MNIMGRRNLWFGISLLVIIPGIISMIYHWVTVGSPLNLGIDFTGGTITSIEFKKDVTVAEVRDILKEIDLGDSVIQSAGSKAVIIRSKALSEDEQKKMQATLADKLGDYSKDKLQVNKVGPVMGKELTIKAILALAVASVLMIIYIGFRFEINFGIAAVLALLHDVLVVMGVFSILWLEVDSSFVAALLTIIGYSINDTIVIFDRIRENLNRRKKGEDLEQLVNKSILQSITRSVNTVLTVVFVLVALLVFGGSTIKLFTLAMLIGVVSGMYSSIFNASPLWIVFKNMQKGKAAA